MITTKTDFSRCLIIATNSDRIKDKFEKISPSRFRLNEINKLLKGKNEVEFIEPKSHTKLKISNYSLLIEDEIENIAQLVYAAYDSKALENIIICKDPEAVDFLIKYCEVRPAFVSLDFNLTNRIDFHPITKRIYFNLKEKWKNIPVIGVTNWAEIDDEPSMDLVKTLRENSDSVYKKSSSNWDALPGIFKDKYEISLLIKEKDELGKKIKKVEENLELLKKAIGVDLSTRKESAEFAALKDPLIGDSYKMKDIRFHIELAAKAKDNILLLGETGTGKELIAKAIHKLSGNQKSIIIVNCAAIPETLIESELFGVIANYPGFHNPKEKIGFFEQAINSTLFLDEIHHLSLSAQAKLLRAIDDRQFYKLGGDQPISLGEKTRIISAAKPNIENLIEDGKFIEDLFGRLNSFFPVISPLRDRKEDILDLVEYFLQQKNSNLVLSSEAKEALVNQSWKRNVRELRNFIFGLHNFYSGQPSDIKTLGTLPKETFIEVDHINYALSLHNKRAADEILIKKVLPNSKNDLKNAFSKSDEAEAKKFLTEFLSAIERCVGNEDVNLDIICLKYTNQKTNVQGIAYTTLSSNFNKFKNYFSKLMNDYPEFSGKLSIALRYNKLRDILKP